jgi:hypothetical protein
VRVVGPVAAGGDRGLGQLQRRGQVIEVGGGDGERVGELGRQRGELIDPGHGVARHGGDVTLATLARLSGALGITLDVHIQSDLMILRIA